MQRSLFVVDGDNSLRDTLGALFYKAGYQVSGFEDAAHFLDTLALQTPSCLLIDLNTPGVSGLDILRRLNGAHYKAPVIVMAGEAEISTAVQAIKFGAFDFIEKPFCHDEMLRRVSRAAMVHDQRFKAESEEKIRSFHGGDRLTAREHDVLQQITSGASNKEAGRELGISPRTIEVHRARIMQKLNAKNAADLVRIVLSQKQAQFG